MAMINRACTKVLAFLGLTWFFITNACPAQTERYELGKRLRRFEVAWQHADQERRNASSEPMQKAVQSFFSLQLAKAARWLDEAYFMARPMPSPSSFERALLAHRLEVQPKTLEPQAARLRLQLVRFYSLEQPSDASLSGELESARFRLEIGDQAGKVCETLELSGQAMLADAEWKPGKLQEGDYTLQVTATTEAGMIRLPPVPISVIADGSTRLEALEAWLKPAAQPAERTDMSETVRLTVRQISQIIRSQIDERPLETDYPAARLLQLAEKLIQTPDKAPEILRTAALDSLWVTLSHHRKSLPVRVQLPIDDAASAQSNVPPTEPRPVLFAFHGAGGSENMFFETYGAGRLIEMATQRGWIVVAPRHPLLGMPMNYREMIEALSSFCPIDKTKVFLVGHSMGGAEVVRQVSLDIDRPQAVVVIGGGGVAKESSQVKEVPWLIAAGELDFGRGGANALAQRLKKFGCNVNYREYPSVEHMVIVQAALDQVFEFLEARLAVEKKR